MKRLLRRASHEQLQALLVVWICAIVAVTVIESRPQSVQSRFGVDILTVTSGQSTMEAFSRAGTYRLHEQEPPPACDLCGPQVEHFDQGRVAHTHHTFDFFERNAVAPATPADADPGDGRTPVTTSLALSGRAVAVELPPPEA